jgi:hypothetical protein
VYMFDGVQSVDNDAGMIIFFPPVDAIQEFKVQTSAMDASFGRSGGGTVNLVFKSGSNQYHGSAFEIPAELSVRRQELFRFPNRTNTPVQAQSVWRHDGWSYCP